MKWIVVLAVIVVIAVAAAVWMIDRSGWQRAVRHSRWESSHREVHGQVEIIIEKVAERGNRREVLDTAHVDWLPTGLPASIHEVALYEALGNADAAAARRNEREV